MLTEYNNNYDYIMNTTELGTPKGLNIEIFNFNSLKQAYINATTDFEKEKV
jgi:spore coat polysaccharide biosynthesis protein SpsF (cytidylyltransferase family)